MNTMNFIVTTVISLFCGFGIGILASQTETAQTYVPIPQTFQQNSATITVVLDTKHCDSVNAYATFDFHTRLIRLAHDSSRVNMERSYMHELVHCVLEHACYDNLSGDEVFVRRFSILLHEALSTQSDKEITP